MVDRDPPYHVPPSCFASAPGYAGRMAAYRRLFVPGGTVTLTVNLADRRARTLTDHIGHLRAAYARVRADRPFDTIAITRLAGPLASDFAPDRGRHRRLLAGSAPQAGRVR